MIILSSVTEGARSGCLSARDVQETIRRQEE